MLVLLDCVGPDALVLVGMLVDEEEDETVEEVKVCEDDVVVWLAVDIKENALKFFLPKVFGTSAFPYRHHLKSPTHITTKSLVQHCRYYNANIPICPVAPVRSCPTSPPII